MIIGTAKRTKEGENKKPTRYYSARQEEAVAKAVHGRRSKNSGATMFDKSDVSTNKFNLECKTKTTHSESISIKKEWFDKNKQEAMFMNKPYSAIVFNFGPDEENHYIIDEYLFLELLAHLNTLEEDL
jgi:hypothetical protein